MLWYYYVMNEMYTGSSPEEIKRQQEKEDTEQVASHFSIHPEQLIPSEILRECGPEVFEFEEMLVLFESKHSLVELHSIIDLTPADAPKHLIRESARIDLTRIHTMKTILKKETNISDEKYKELDIKYLKLSRAVGIINKNKVDHNR